MLNLKDTLFNNKFIFTQMLVSLILSQIIQKQNYRTLFLWAVKVTFNNISDISWRSMFYR